MKALDSARMFVYSGIRPNGADRPSSNKRIWKSVLSRVRDHENRENALFMREPRTPSGRHKTPQIFLTALPGPVLIVCVVLQRGDFKAKRLQNGLFCHEFETAIIPQY